MHRTTLSWLIRPEVRPGALFRATVVPFALVPLVCRNVREGDLGKASCTVQGVIREDGAVPSTLYDGDIRCHPRRQGASPRLRRRRPDGALPEWRPGTSNSTCLSLFRLPISHSLPFRSATRRPFKISLRRARRCSFFSRRDSSPRSGRSACRSNLRWDVWSDAMPISPPRIPKDWLHTTTTLSFSSARLKAPTSTWTMWTPRVASHREESMEAVSPPPWLCTAKWSER